MNGLWDNVDRNAGSVWCDAYAAASPLPDGVGDAWHGATHFYHLPHTDPDLANGYTPFCYDELCDEDAASGLQTRAKWSALAQRTVVPSYAAVAFTFNAPTRELVLGIKDGHLANLASKLYVAHEFFFFGEDESYLHDYQLSLVDWYGSRGMAPYLVPVVNVSNAPHKGSRAYRAFSYNPGTVYGYWCQLLQRLRTYGAPRDAWVWGSGYKRATELGGRGSAVQALDHALAVNG